MRDWRSVSGFKVVCALCVVLFTVSGVHSAQAGSWFKAAAGVSGMAMDDVNDGTFQFYDNSTFDFPELNDGFALSLALGYDLSPLISLGFSWERQYAGVKGTDEDITAKLDLDANFFMGTLYWRPVQSQKFQFGAALGLGGVFPTGQVKVSNSDNVNFGQDKATASAGFATALMLVGDYALGSRTWLELTVGYRSAEASNVEVANTPVYNADGTAMSLDYTGYTLMAGIKWVFAD